MDKNNTPPGAVETGPHRWQELGGQMMLVAAPGARVVLAPAMGPGPAKPIVTRDHQGFLRPIKPTDPVAIATEHLPLLVRMAMKAAAAYDEIGQSDLDRDCPLPLHLDIGMARDARSMLVRMENAMGMPGHYLKDRLPPAPKVAHAPVVTFDAQRDVIHSKVADTTRYKAGPPRPGVASTEATITGVNHDLEAAMTLDPMPEGGHYRLDPDGTLSIAWPRVLTLEEETQARETLTRYCDGLAQ